MKILVIDDDPDILELVAIVLRSHNMGAITLSDPKLLLKQLAQNKPDLLLMDINMPPFDGRHLCAELKANKLNIPIVLFPANNITPESIVDCRADGFLQKPFDIDKLIATVHVTLKQYLS